MDRGNIKIDPSLMLTYEKKKLLVFLSEIASHILKCREKTNNHIFINGSFLVDPLV